MTTPGSTGLIAMMVDNPSGSAEIYNKLRAELELTQPLGGVAHIAGPSPNGGWRVIELWHSQEEAIRFLQERFGPAWQAVGGTGPPPQPEFWPVENHLTGPAS